jgi:hypothetical protein
MFERLHQAAEKAAVAVSRRRFLGRLGQVAMASAAAIGGVLLWPGQAQAMWCGRVKCPSGHRCCSTPYGRLCIQGNKCP